MFPPKELRDKARLKPSSRVTYAVEEGKLVVEPIPSLADVMTELPMVEISTVEFKRFRRQLSKKAEA